MSRRKVIIWTIGIDDLKRGIGQVGGLTVQMMFWAAAFNKASFNVYSFSKRTAGKSDGVSFLYFPQSKFFSIAMECLYSIYYVALIRPDIIMFRGASRTLFFLSYLSSIFNIKLVFMGASDVNFSPGREYIAAGFHNRKLYQLGLRKTKYIVVQNVQQANLLMLNYNKSSISIPNIWESVHARKDQTKQIIWVGNFRSLKRPEWFIKLAKSFPNQEFVMAGAPYEKSLYEHCVRLSENVHNLTIFGCISFSQSEALFDGAQLLICTSEYEGFPNTFLQAWSRDIPVLSTVDPSSLISNRNLGMVVSGEVDMVNKLSTILNDRRRFADIQSNISRYFQSSHSSDLHLDRLLKYIGCI